MKAQNFTLGDEGEDRSPQIGFELEIPLATAARSRSRHAKRQKDVLVGPDKDIASLEGFYAPLWKRAVYVLLAVCSLGLSLLLSRWSPKLGVSLRLARCALSRAEWVKVTMVDGRTGVVPVTLHSSWGAGGKEPERLLEWRCHRYFYVLQQDTFLPVPDVPKAFPAQLQAAARLLAGGATPARVAEAAEWDIADRQLRYGPNEMHIPVRSIGSLVFEEMWHPFYCFQYFSVLVWCIGDQYYTYAVCILVITMFSIITSAVETHANARRLASIAYFACEVDVVRQGVWVRLPSPQLVPGDVVAVAEGPLPADCVLLTGEAIVDENMLTGESVPVRKVAYSPQADGLGYSPDRSPGSTLYSGTTVAQARAPRGAAAPLAMVARTRFYSAKGQLLRSILHPREQGASFVSDSLRFIVVMLVVCMGLFVWAAVELAEMGADPLRIFVRFLDMITVAVPPALPACLTIATVFSLGRLRRRDVYVTGPDTISVAGQLDVVCFDKTGTLTEPGLELDAIVAVQSGAFDPPTNDVRHLPPSVAQLLASCHGLARMGGTLVGDPLDQRLFAATGWTLHDGDRDGSGGGAAGSTLLGAAAATTGQAAAAGPASVEAWVCPPSGSHLAVTIVRRCEFQSALQRNLVVVQPPAQPPAAVPVAAAAPPPPSPPPLVVYLKGSPEVIRGLVAASSVPEDFETVLGEYTRQGLRVLALAAGQLPAPGAPGALSEAQLAGATQAQLEAASQLQLVGLAVMANPLRPDSASVVAQLQAARMRVAMVTGDHVRTAISVAGQCGILPTSRPVLLVDAAAAAPPPPPPPPPAATAPAALPSSPPAAPAPVGSPESPATSPPGAAALHGASPPTAAADGLASAANARGGGLPHVPSFVQMPTQQVKGGTVGVPGAPPLPPPSTGLVFTVLYPDGSQLTGAHRSMALPQVITGDMECAVTGAGFSAMLATDDGAALEPVLRRAAVWARMTPDNKRDLMGLLGGGLEAHARCPSLGLTVAFCGDGANDCGALKAAHVGVSLCEAEASVAAPMTSRHQSTSAMLTVVGEGRCSLMATYQIFQFIVGYAMAQAFSTNLMYTFALTLGNNQYLIQDLFYITVLAGLMGYTRPREALAPLKPVARVMSPALLIPTVLQIGVVIVFQLAALRLLYWSPGYTPTQGTPDLRTVVAPETSVIFLMGLCQFIILALVFNKGWPHRQPLWTNLALTAALVAQTAFLLYSLFAVTSFTTGVEEMVTDDSAFDTALRAALLVLMVVNAVVAFGAELLASPLLVVYEWVRDRLAAARKRAHSDAGADARVALLAPPPVSGSSGDSWFGSPPPGSPAGLAAASRGGDAANGLAGVRLPATNHRASPGQAPGAASLL